MVVFSLRNHTKTHKSENQNDLDFKIQWQGSFVKKSFLHVFGANFAGKDFEHFFEILEEVARRNAIKSGFRGIGSFYLKIVVDVNFSWYRRGWNRGEMCILSSFFSILFLHTFEPEPVFLIFRILEFYIF